MEAVESELTKVLVVELLLALAELDDADEEPDGAHGPILIAS